MKRNVIAILLSISLIAGSFGAAPLYAAEVTTQEGITENEQGGASVPSEDELSASGEEEAAPDVSSQSAEGQSVENEPVGGEAQIISNEIEEPGNGITQELDENEITEEGLSDEEAIGEEAGSAATDVDTEIAAVVEPILESTEGKEAALEGEVVVDSGESGDLLWELTGDEAGMVLRISGNGYMTSYQEGSAPWATYRRLIETVIVEENVKSIGNYAFYGLNNMTSITLPSSMRMGIGMNAFASCSSLTSIDIPNGINSIGYGAFHNCSGLKSVSIPDSVTRIDAHAFRNCSSLKNISIPNSVTTISMYAFFDCDSLEEIVIPENVTALNEAVFANCDSLTSVTIEGRVTIIGESAFGACVNLTDFTIPETVSIIKQKAFSRCTSLEEITIPKYVESVGWQAFYGCINLEEVIIQPGVELVYNGAFSNCSNLKHISIPNTVTSLGQGTLRDCTSLTEIVIPESVSTLELDLFNGCNGLKTVSLPNSIVSIQDNVFKGCNSLEQIVIPEGVTSIGNDAFSNCPQLCVIVYIGSFAENYAIENNIRYRAICKNHSWDVEYSIDKVPTCLEEGTESIHCSICGVIKEGTERTLDKTDHNYGDWRVVNEATCTSDGSREKECIICEDKVTEVIPATGHDYSEWRVLQEPTCINDGVKCICCSICGEEQDGGETAIPALGHMWEDQYTVDQEATCIDNGSESIHCAECDAINEETIRVIPKKEHAYGDWTVIKEAMCTEAGSKEKVCADCGDKVTEETPAKGHSWKEEYTVDQEATCTEEGSESIHCAECDAINDETIRVIPKKEHAYGDWTVTKEATCTEAGSREEVCADCGDRVTEETPAKGHSWKEEYTVDQEATCTEEGSESIHCAECDAINEATIRAIPKKEHAYGDWTVTKEATCTEAGSKEKVCVDCGETDTVEIPAFGHLYGEVIIEPTCTTGGYTIHVCGRCSDSYKDHETTPTGHSFTDWVIDNDSTCTEEGIQHRECEACGYTETKGINKKEHSFDTEYTVDKEPTCTADGSKSYHCTAEGCTATTGSEVIPATGHNYGDWTVTREATCTESGEMERTCAVCDETETVEFGARGHVWLKTPTVDQEATCTEEGSESIRCAVCDEIKEGSVQAIPPKRHRLIHFEAVEPTYESDGNIEYYRCEQCGHMYGDQNCDNEISAGDIVIPALEWISVNQVSLNKSEITINRYVKEQLEVTVSPENATNKRVNWASSDENVAIVDENGAVTGNGFGDAVITATAEDGGISAQCTVHVVSRVKIVTQPANKAAESGETVAFTVEAEGNELSYQWQWSADGTTWKNCASTSYNTAAFTFVMKEKYAGRQYRCIVSGEGEIITSDAALLSLKEEEKFKVQPADAEAADGEMASFHVEFEGDSPTYRWQWSADGTVWKNCTGSGYNTDTFSFVMKEKYEGRKYRCVVKDGTETYTSNVATLKLGKSLKITLQPEDATVSAGQSALFHVEAEGSSIAYQWQVSSTGTTWKNCTGAGYNTDTFSFTTKSTFSGRKYRCKISDGTNTIISDSAELTVTE